MRDTLTLVGLTVLLVALLSLVLLNHLIYPVAFFGLAIPCYFGDLAVSIWRRSHVTGKPTKLKTPLSSSRR
ncbi:hypothetical protein [Levilactobacillus spicheri]